MIVTDTRQLGQFAQDAADFLQQFIREIERQLRIVAATILRQLQAQTPVRTGNARRSWVVIQQGLGIDIRGAYYVEYLNKGISTAPRGFIEQAIERGFRAFERNTRVRRI